MEAFGLVCLYGITAFDDYRTRHIKLMELLIFAVIGICLDIVYTKYSLTSILGGVGVGVAMYIFSILSKEKIGRGDALLVMVTGLYLGFMNTVILLWLSSVLAAIVGLILIRKYDNGKDKELPFVPFILLAFLILYTIKTLGGCIG